jgi:putative ABC transport system permease protein
MVENESKPAAKLWFWKRVIESIPSIIIDRLTMSISMFKNYLKTAFKNIIRHKIYYSLNILGLGLGMAFFIFTLIYNSLQFGYDRFHKNADSIFSVVKENSAANNTSVHSAILPFPMLPAMIEEFPEIENGTRYMPAGRKIVRAYEKVLYENAIRYVDPSFLSMFSFKMIKGNPLTALSEPFSAVISRETAIKYFGKADPIGKTLSIDNQTDVQVNGIIDEPPEYSSIHYNILVSFSTISSQNPKIENWDAERCMIMLQLNNKNKRQIFETKLPEFISKHYASDNNYLKQLYLHPLTDFHLNSMHIDSFLNSQLATGCYIFLAISIVLLIIACFNFVNLSTAKSFTRMREIGIRAVVGANRTQLVRQFLSESIVVSLLSLPVAIIIYEFLIIPYFTALIGESRDIYTIANNSLVFSKIVLASVLLGVLAGFYPAFAASRLKISEILNNKSTHGTGGTRIRKVLIISQFVASIMAIVMTFMLKEQREYLLNMDLGYDRENVIVLNTSSRISNSYEVFREQLLKYGNIISVSASSGLVSRWNPDDHVIPEGKDINEAITMNTYGVNYDFIESLKLKVLNGRGFSKNFQDENSLLVNEKAVYILGWEDPIGKTLTIGEKEGTIIGVVKDFNFKELFWDIIPTVLYIEPVYFNYFYIRVLNQENTSTIDQIRVAWENCFPDYPFEYSLLVNEFKDQNFAMYALQGIFALIGYISGFYSLFGIIGLSMYSVLRRSKEIGIRKVFGASSTRILRIFYTEYLVQIGISCIIAFPITYFLTKKILEIAWASSTDIKLEVFAFVYLLLLVFVSLSVLFQTLRAANANPVYTIRHE